MKHYLIFIHGMGEQKPGWHKKSEKSIRRSFQKAAVKQEKGKPPNDAIVTADAYWADITQKDQNRLRETFNRRGNIRRFLASSLGDVIPYAKVPGPHNQYERIHSRFRDALQTLSLSAQESGDGTGPLTVVTHSLGTVIASDAVYDLLKSGQFPTNLKFHNFFTFGSPIALFGLRFGIENFNEPVTPEVWLNFFYSDAVFGYPLRKVNEAYSNAVSEDIKLSTAGSSGLLLSLLKWPLVNTIGQLPFVNAGLTVDTSPMAEMEEAMYKILWYPGVIVFWIMSPGFILMFTLYILLRWLVKPAFALPTFRRFTSMGKLKALVESKG